MTANPEQLVCRRCDRPVRESASQYEVFEQMHYVCFHYEFEHDPADPDEVCASGGCPSGAVTGGLDRVTQAVRSLAEAAAEAPDWENDSLSAYLEALSAWLADSDGYYLNQARVPPSNPWERMLDAFQAATVYE